MLRGYQTLLLLIGKKSPVSFQLNKTIEDAEDPASIGDTNETSTVELEKHETWKSNTQVECPVCSRKICANNDRINMHIDQCLLESSKQIQKKVSTQRTLLELNSWHMLLVKHRKMMEEEKNCGESGELKCGVEGNAQVSKASSLSSGGENNSFKSDCGFLWNTSQGTRSVCVECGRISLFHSEGYFEKSSDRKLFSTALPDMENNPCTVGVNHTYMTEQEEILFHEIEDKENVWNCPLTSAVVGRKFHQDVAAEAGQKVGTMRERSNLKDQNAVLVILEGFPNRILGFLPREVSRHVAPILDSGKVTLKGEITGSPKGRNAPLPLRLVCRLSSCEGPTPDTLPPVNAWLAAVRAAESHLRKAVPQRKKQKQKTAAEGEETKAFVCSLEGAMEGDVPVKGEEEGEEEDDVRGMYQRNFLYLLSTVLDQDAHLFTPEEIVVLNEFRELPGSSQRLFVRLYQRKGPWFRVSSLAYDDVDDVATAVRSLIGSKFLDDGFQEGSSHPSQAAAQEWLETLTVPLLRSFLEAALHMTKAEVLGMKRDELLMSARAAVEGSEQQQISPSGSILALQVAKLCGPCVRIPVEKEILFSRVERVFFLNEQQDLSTFLLTDLGSRKYPQYECWRTEPIFPNRKVLREYEQALDLAHKMHAAVDAGQVAASCDVLAEAMRQLAACGPGPYAPSPTSPSLSSPSSFPPSFPEATSGVVCWECRKKGRQKRGREAEEGEEGGGGGGAAERKKGGASSSRLFFSRFRAGRVYCAIGTVGVSVLERERRYALAVPVLRQLLASGWSASRRGMWTVRLAVDLHHCGQVEAGLRLAEDSLSGGASWLGGGHRLALEDRVLRLARPPRRWKGPRCQVDRAARRKVPEVRILGRPLRQLAPAGRSVFYGYDCQLCSVEELALQHYAGINRDAPPGGGDGASWRGTHSEGGVWHTLFGLLMWDEMFARVENVFYTPFQTAPLDLFTDAFLPARQPLIRRKLDRILAGAAPAILAATWRRHEGTWCAGVNWGRHSLCELQTMAACVGGPGLAAVMQRLAEDYGTWSSGMPDLLLWRAVREGSGEEGEEGEAEEEEEEGEGRRHETKEEEVWTEGGMPRRREKGGRSMGGVEGEEAEEERRWRGFEGKAKLVEVKGPRDRLSDQQRAWIQVLMEAGLDVEVCKVVETEDALQG